MIELLTYSELGAYIIIGIVALLALIPFFMIIGTLFMGENPLEEVGGAVILCVVELIIGFFVYLHATGFDWDSQIQLL